MNKRWQYLVADVSEYHHDGDSLRDWYTLDVAKLDLLGADGWELVDLRSAAGRAALFKRPRKSRKARR